VVWGGFYFGGLWVGGGGVVGVGWGVGGGWGGVCFLTPNTTTDPKTKNPTPQKKNKTHPPPKTPPPPPNNKTSNVRSPSRTPSFLSVLEFLW